MLHPEQSNKIKHLEAEREQSKIDWQRITTEPALAELRVYLSESQQSDLEIAMAEVDNGTRGIAALQRAKAYANILAYIIDKLS